MYLGVKLLLQKLSTDGGQEVTVWSSQSRVESPSTSLDGHHQQQPGVLLFALPRRQPSIPLPKLRKIQVHDTSSGSSVYPNRSKVVVDLKQRFKERNESIRALRPQVSSCAFAFDQIRRPIPQGHRPVAGATRLATLPSPSCLPCINITLTITLPD